MADLLELAARCEAAEGPDRQLDAMIGAATRQMPITDPGAFLQEWPLSFQVAKFSGSIAATNEAGDMVCHWAAREFTASIDDAMQLLREGTEWKLESWPDSRSGKQVYQAWVFGASRVKNATTPALALCAAALRARSVNTPQDQEEGL